MNHNNKHIDTYIHGRRQSTSNIDLIARKKQNKDIKNIQNEENRKIK